MTKDKLQEKVNRIIGQLIETALDVDTLRRQVGPTHWNHGTFADMHENLSNIIFVLQEDIKYD